MSLFKKVHSVTVPTAYLDKGVAPIELRFSQLNPGKMAKANQRDTLKSIGWQNEIMAELSDEQRQASLDRQREKGDPEEIKRREEKAGEPDEFDDFDQNNARIARACPSPGRE